MLLTSSQEGRGPPAHPWPNNIKDSFRLFQIQNNLKDSFCLFRISDLLPTADDSRQTAQLASQSFLRLPRKVSQALGDLETSKSPRQHRFWRSKQERKKKRTQCSHSHGAPFQKFRKIPQRKRDKFRVQSEPRGTFSKIPQRKSDRLRNCVQTL